MIVLWKALHQKQVHWYENREKSSTFSLNLEKCNGRQRKIGEIIVNDQDVTDLNKIKNEIINF